MAILKQQTKKRRVVNNNHLSPDLAKPLITPSSGGINSINKMEKLFCLLMLVFGYSVRSQITASFDTEQMNSALASVKEAAYRERVSAEKVLKGLKGWQDVFDMNVNYQLKKIGVPGQLQKMGFQTRIGLLLFTSPHIYIITYIKQQFTSSLKYLCAM